MDLGRKSGNLQQLAIVNGWYILREFQGRGRRWRLGAVTYLLF